MAPVWRRPAEPYRGGIVCRGGGESTEKGKEDNAHPDRGSDFV